MADQNQERGDQTQGNTGQKPGGQQGQSHPNDRTSQERGGATQQGDRDNDMNRNRSQSGQNQGQSQGQPSIDRDR